MSRRDEYDSYGNEYENGSSTGRRVFEGGHITDGKGNASGRINEDGIITKNGRITGHVDSNGILWENGRAVGHSNMREQAYGSNEKKKTFSPRSNYAESSYTTNNNNTQNSNMYDYPNYDLKGVPTFTRNSLIIRLGIFLVFISVYLIVFSGWYDSYVKLFVPIMLLTTLFIIPTFDVGRYIVSVFIGIIIICLAGLYLNFVFNIEVLNFWRGLLWFLGINILEVAYVLNFCVYLDYIEEEKEIGKPILFYSVMIGVNMILLNYFVYILMAINLNLKYSNFLYFLFIFPITFLILKISREVFKFPLMIFTYFFFVNFIFVLLIFG